LKNLYADFLESPRSEIFFTQSEKSETMTAAQSFVRSLELDEAFLFFPSSGSSGQKKWMAHSQKSLEAAAHAVNSFVNATEKDVWGVALPSFHLGGYSIFVRAHLASAQTCQFLQKWNAMAFESFLKEHRVSFTSLVPTQLYDLVQAGVKAPNNLRAVFVGGAPLSQVLLDAALALAWPVLYCYGLTESAGMILCSEVNKNSLSLKPLTHVTHLQLNNSLLEFSAASLFIGSLYLRDDVFSWEKRVEEKFKTLDAFSVEEDRYCFLSRQSFVKKSKGEFVDFAELAGNWEAFCVQEKMPLKSVLFWGEDDRDGVQAVLYVEEKFFKSHELEFFAFQKKWNAMALSLHKIQAIRLIQEIPRLSLEKINFMRLPELAYSLVENRT